MNITRSKSLYHILILFAVLASLLEVTPAQAAENASELPKQQLLNSHSGLLDIRNYSIMPGPSLLDPPFSGTIFIDPDIITPSDPTTLLSVVYAGRGFRTMFDRRINDWITVNAYLFNTSFDDALTTEIQVNPEFGSSQAALIEAQKYGRVIGQLPTALRIDVQFVWIHEGVEPFGGGNNSLLIHTGKADLYDANGILEETLVHEASHTSLDVPHASAPGWLAAQTADDTFISTYARDNPTTEDIAESFLPYLAIRYRLDRISQSLKDTIVQAIPNRIAYFDQKSFNMHPINDTTLTLNSSGAQDGWIRESSENSKVGGTLNATAATFAVGDDAAKKQYLGILSFKTGASLPDNATITSVTLKIRRNAVVGSGNPLTTFQGFMVDIKTGFFGTTALQTGDFQAKASNIKSYGPFKPALVSNWYGITLTSGKAYINKVSTNSGLTQIRLCFKLDDNNNTVANYLSLYSGNAAAANRPQLVITYYVP